jgi:phasin family protein
MTDYMSQWIEYSKAAAEPMMKLNELGLKTLDQMTQQQMELTKDYLDLGTRGLKRLSEAKDPQEFWTAQAELLKEYGDKIVARARSYADLASQTQSQLAEWQETTMREVGKKLEEAEKKVA